ncbi:hypothetical protein [Bradyrhizobium sp.]|uniref:hypothetical protein n=1 Tax=Bradyrhizobium sp. TaxID=376 RepID=UPI0025BD80E6|nr:hypothetical protein [Bradyrhizobium sp.]MBV8921801.1 hypothetical protein [Bradyrhizobium sp.]
MAGISGTALAEVKAMDRKHACLARAAACRERAEADPQNHDYWMQEAIRWLDLAQGPTGPVAVTFEARDQQNLPPRDDGLSESMGPRPADGERAMGGRPDLPGQLNRATSMSRTRPVQQIQ